jgi:hypothetical protein
LASRVAFLFQVGGGERYHRAMNEAAPIADAELVGRVTELEADCDRLLARAFVLTGQVASLDETVREMRALMGLDPLPRMINEDWRMIKQVAAELHLSQSGVRARIKRGVLAAEKHGGRVYVRAAK